MLAPRLSEGLASQHNADCKVAGPSAAAWKRVRCMLARVMATALLLFAANGMGAAYAANGVESPPDEIAVEAQMLVDPGGRLELGAVIQRFEAGDGRPVVQRAVVPLEGTQAVWYRLLLPPAVPAVPHLLLLPHPGLDAADLYTNDSAQASSSWRVQLSGDTRAVAHWSVPNLFPAFKLPELPGPRAPAYLRVSNIYPVSVSWMVMDALAFQGHIKRWYLLLGIYVGLMVLIFAVSCAQGVIWQEPIHFLFAGFVVVNALAQLAATGLAGEYLWPQLAWWNDRSLSTLPIASSMLLLLFFHRLLAERAAPSAMRGFMVVVALGVFALVFSVAPDRSPLMRYLALYYILTLLAYLAAAVWYVRRKRRVGVWLLAAVLCLCSGASLPILRLLGAIPSTVATQYGAHAGAALQIPLLMMALFFRNREKRANLMRFASLERTDPLTGMGNHRVLLRHLERVSRSTAQAAVMRIHISNISAIRHEYGLDVAQACVVHASALAVSLVPEGDAVARHREGDLVLVFKGPVSRAWLLETGQRIIARGLTGASGLPSQVTLQFKIAVLMAPFESTDPTALLHLLESLISGMGQRSGTGLRIAERALPAVPHVGLHQRTRMPGTAPGTGSST